MPESVSEQPGLTGSSRIAAGGTPRPDTPDAGAELLPSGPAGALGVLATGTDEELGDGAGISRPGPRGGWAVARQLGLGFWIPAGFVIVVILAAIFASVLPIPSPYAIDSLPKQGPSIHHWLGTDELGRDLLSRLIYGARVSLTVGFAAYGLGLFIGGTFGLIAGYYGKVADGVVGFFTTSLLAFPALVLALAVITFVGRSLLNVTLVIGVLAIAPVVRIVRAATIGFARREFVLSARALGAKNRRIILREILPNVIPTALAFSFVGIGLAIVGEGALAFLGLSVLPPTPTWGGMISEGQNVLQQDAWVALAPSLAMLLLVLALNFAGDRVRSFLDVKEGAL